MRRRNAFTLLEVLLAMAIAVMVLAAVYTFVGYQLKQAQAGREVIESTTLARSILGRIDSDVRGTISLNDPGRYRVAPDVSSDTSSPATTAAASTTGTTTTGASGASGASLPSAASAASTASSPSSGSSASSSAATGSNASSSSSSGPVELPLGVIGTSTELSIFMSRVPGEIFSDNSTDAGSLTSDLRRISYWLGGEGSKSGLCRMEVRLITSDLALNPDLPTGDVDSYLYAGEVKSVQFQYFDGTAWQDSWDSTTIGPDNVTPIGSPRAVSIKIGVLPQGASAALAGVEPALKSYRRVIQIPTANGTPKNSNAEGGTTAP